MLAVPCPRSCSCLAHVHLPQAGRALLKVLLLFSACALLASGWPCPALLFSACALASGWPCPAQGPAPVWLSGSASSAAAVKCCPPGCRNCQLEDFYKISFYVRFSFSLLYCERNCLLESYNFDTLFVKYLLRIFSQNLLTTRLDLLFSRACDTFLTLRQGTRTD